MHRKVVRSAAREPSFREAAEALGELADLPLSNRRLDRIAHQVGPQLHHERDQQVDPFQANQLEPRVATRPALAVVEVDGGRLQVRAEAQGRGPGAHQAAWREDKIAVLATMTHVVSSCDPQPDLPHSFRDRTTVEKLIGAIGGTGPMASTDPLAQPDGELIVSAPEPQKPWIRPELSVRTFVATLCPVDRFGPMVRAEAHRRNFAKAAARAFLGDGSAWIWGLHRREFSDFVAIVDLLHVLVHRFTAARAMAGDAENRWELFQTWAEWCWQGQVDRVIVALGSWCEEQARLGGGLDALGEDDPRRVVTRVQGYLQTN